MATPLLTHERFLPTPFRRGPAEYRVSTKKSASYATKRVLGMWVPQAAFRAGSLVVVEGSSPTSGLVFILSVGGEGNTVNGGVSITLTTGPAAACRFRITAQQESDSLLPTFRTAGVFQGSTAGFITPATLVPFLQPLNFIEVSTSGTFTIDNMSLEFLPPQRVTQYAHAEIRNT